MLPKYSSAAHCHRVIDAVPCAYHYSVCHYACFTVASHYCSFAACMHPPAEDWATPQKPLPELPAPEEAPTIGSDVDEPEDNIQE
jgi:hypothetical protein